MNLIRRRLAKARRTAFSARLRARPVPEPLEPRELLTAFGAFIEFNITTPASKPWDIAAGPDGNMWFTESAGNKIGQIGTNGGTITEYPVPTPGSMPYGIVSGGSATGRLVLFFTEFAGGKLGQITTSGTISEAPVLDQHNNPVPGTQLVDLAMVDPGFARVSQQNSRVVTLFDCTGSTPVNIVPNANYPQPESSTENSGNTGVAFDSSSRVYFTERNTDKIAVYSVNRSGVGSTTEYSLPSGSQPVSITPGPDGNMWFTEFGTGKIGMFNVATHQITEYPLPDSSSEPWGIAAGQNGEMFFTTYKGNTIGEINVFTHMIVQDTLPSAGSGPRGITVDADGNPWFVETDGNRVAKYDVHFTIYTTPDGQAAGGITSGPDGNLWFTETEPSTIASLTTEGKITEYTIPAPASNPHGITTGPDRSLWVALSVSQQVGQFNTSGQLLGRFASPSADGDPQWITPGPNSTLWYTTQVNPLLPFGNLDHITTGGVVSRGTLPRGSGVGAVTLGPDGNLWFTLENFLGPGSPASIGRVHPDGSQLTLFPVTLQKPAPVQLMGITTGPDGNLWFTTGLDDEIGRITPQGQIRMFPYSTFADFNRIVAGPDGNLWVTDGLRSFIYRVTTSGVITPFLVPESPANTGDITVGPDGNLWFVALPDFLIQYRLQHAGAALTPTQSFIAAAYQQLVGAPIAPNRLAELSALVPGASSAGARVPSASVRRRVAQAILRSREYQARVVQAVTVAYLLRPPSPDELDAGIALLQHGGTEQRLRLTVLSSPAYDQARGGSAAAFVQALAHDVLHRNPTAGELTRWTRRLNQGVPRRALVRALLHRPEALRVQVAQAYHRVLQRDPTALEQSTQASTLARGRTVEHVILGLVTSPRLLRPAR